MKGKKFDINDLIPLSEASNYSGLSAGHLNYLVRNKKVWGIKLGRNWFTTYGEIKDYIKRENKPGPKKY